MEVKGNEPNKQEEMRERKVSTVVSRFPAVLPDECYRFVIGTPGREFSFSKIIWENYGKFRKIMSLDLDMLALGHFCWTHRGD